MEEFGNETREPHNCVVNLRRNPVKRKEKVVIGCGAGFAGDRPAAALKLLQRVKELDYLVLECLAERTLAERYRDAKSGGKGYDPRISEWMQLLLPLAVERGVCIITNMGAKSPHGAQEEVLQIASKMGLSIKVGLAYQSSVSEKEVDNQLKLVDSDLSVYLGAAPIVECLERHTPDVLITSRVADASLFLGPMVFELGWNWNEFPLLAQGSLAGHLLECGCQLTGGYYMHPGDKHRNITFQNLLETSLPFAEITFDGTVSVAKAEGTRGVLNFSTCAEQLLYEVGDPSSYITPDVIVDFQDVTFQSLSESKVLCSGAKPSIECLPEKLLLLKSKDIGWKGWGEISYGGYGTVQRAKAADYLVRAWMEELYPSISINIASYIIGQDSLKATCAGDILSKPCEDIRLRMDGLFEKEEHAIQFTKEFTALYTNGPAGGGGISTGSKKENFLEKELVGREYVHWQISAARNNKISSINPNSSLAVTEQKLQHESNSPSVPREIIYESSKESIATGSQLCAAPAGQKIPLYDVAHSRAGDKGNDLNFSIIPHYPPDIRRLKMIVTPNWVKEVLSPLLNPSSFPDPDDIERRDKWINEHVKVEMYEARGIHSLNVVVRNILDGGVNCSRRIDRHGKTISDVVLCQQVVLPP
ncbi:propionyl-CoA carboxylase [Perilla frutescens var. hirtella]|nr:propionyl-CoA carboxylase [Perilla frutescens var. hirtella]KAH6812112.1 propionyl-CoA carboxylase [Perilla frutescens var. frutescens]